MGTVALLPLLMGAGSLRVDTDCTTFQNQRDQLSTQALQAEISLVLNIRRRLCPQEESLAEQDNANLNGKGSRNSAADLDYGAYIRCRQQAELLLRRTRPVLYRNQQAFLYYTPEGARLARESDELTRQLSAACSPRLGGHAVSVAIGNQGHGPVIKMGIP